MTDVHDISTGEEPLASTVSALLEEARWVLDEERLHGERLDTKLGLLAGFAGVVLALLVPIGGNVFGGTAGLVFDVFYLASVLLLVGGALLPISVLIGTRTVRLGGREVSAPWRRIGVNDEVLDKLSGDFTAEPTVQVERRMIATVVEGIRDQRNLSARRWAVLRLAALCLAGALLSVVGQSVTLAFAW